MTTLFLLGAGLIVHLGGVAAPVPTEPILTIDAGNNLVPVICMVDRKGKWLVSGGQDRSIRIWSLPDCRPIRTIWPPIGPGTEGLGMGAAALSADGSRIAVGTAYPTPWIGGSAVYVFDRESGTMRHCIEGIPSAVLNLSLSSDGKFVAVGCAGRAQVYNLESSAALAWEATGFSGGVYGVDFSSDGRLVVSGDDSQIKVFSPAGELLAATAAQGRGAAREPRFSPDGKLIAIPGGREGVEVRSTGDLKLLYSASSKGALRGGLDYAAWSPDGKLLAAGLGAQDRLGRYILRIWRNKGIGPHRDAALPAFIKGLRACPDGFVVELVTNEVYLVRPDGNASVLVPAPRFHFKGPSFSISTTVEVAGPLIQASPDLSSVAVPCAYPKGTYLSFDLRRRIGKTLRRAPAPGGAFSPAVLRSRQLWTQPGEWIEPEKPGIPIINGKPVTPDPGGSWARSWAFVPDPARLAVGAIWSL